MTKTLGRSVKRYWEKGTAKCGEEDASVNGAKWRDGRLDEAIEKVKQDPYPNEHDRRPLGSLSIHGSSFPFASQID